MTFCYPTRPCKRHLSQSWWKRRNVSWKTWASMNNWFYNVLLDRCVVSVVVLRIQIVTIVINHHSGSCGVSDRGCGHLMNGCYKAVVKVNQVILEYKDLWGHVANLQKRALIGHWLFSDSGMWTWLNGLRLCGSSTLSDHIIVVLSWGSESKIFLTLPSHQFNLTGGPLNTANEPSYKQASFGFSAGTILWHSSL